jgi:hypothetical protein
MHINLRQNHDEYNEEELIHLQKCYQCQEDLKSIEQLYSSAKTLPLLVPEEFNWQVIQQKTIIKKQSKVESKTRPFIYQQMMAVAASTFFIAVGWLVWNNHQLQSQLEQVLLVNQSLELQLYETKNPTFHQVNVLNEVRNIEIQLASAETKKQKLALLTARTKLIQEMVNAQNGEENAISI